VNARVGNVKNNDPGLVEPVDLYTDGRRVGDDSAGTLKVLPAKLARRAGEMIPYQRLRLCATRNFGQCGNAKNASHLREDSVNAVFNRSE
jgi:hypothetical protein